jgi:hypothetical protein
MKGEGSERDQILYIPFPEAGRALGPETEKALNFQQKYIKVNNCVH